jgi:ABC-type multidrug transport system fused ATPase/permease subunit
MTHDSSSEPVLPRRPILGALRSTVRVFRIAAPRPLPTAAILLLTVLEALVPVATPWVVGATFDRVVLDPVAPGIRLERLALYLGLLLGVEGLAFAAAVVRTVRMRRESERLLQAMRRRVHERLLALPAAFHDRHPRGALAARLLDDTDSIVTLLNSALGSLATAPAMFLGTLAAMAAVSPRLAGLVLLPIPFILLVCVAASRTFRRGFAAARGGAEALSVHAAETLDGIRAVQLCRAEGWARERFDARQEVLAAARIALARRSAFVFPMLGLLTVAGTLLALGAGGPAVPAGDLTPGNLVAFLTWMGMFYAPVLEMARSNYAFQNIAACADRLFEILDAPPGVADAPDAATLPACRGAMALENVSFTYPGAPRPALHGISLALAPGEAVALVGPSGAGKSTLVRLLPRLYDPDAGCVRLDGTDLKTLRLDDVRRHVALVPQEDRLIGETVDEAVRLGCVGADAAAVGRALRVAQARGFVDALPGGATAPLAAGGGNLSAGQRQRLAIARALVRDPAVLALDEAASALDPATEQALWNGLFEAFHGRVLIGVAHRPATAARFPRVLVLEDGRITGDGTPDTLRTTHPYFKSFAAAGTMQRPESD